MGRRSGSIGEGGWARGRVGMAVPLGRGAGMHKGMHAVKDAAAHVLCSSLPLPQHAVVFLDTWYLQ